MKLVRSGIFLPEGTSLPEKPRVASTRKEDYMPVGVRGPIKNFFKGGKITFWAQDHACRAEAGLWPVMTWWGSTSWEGATFQRHEASSGISFHLWILISCRIWEHIYWAQCRNWPEIYRMLDSWPWFAKQKQTSTNQDLSIGQIHAKSESIIP